MSKVDRVDILPQPRILLSLRNNTLSKEEAMADLIDNSLDQDVGATEVHIVKDANSIYIADNGRGMNRALLIDALKLGSKGQGTPTANDLGLFGIGLKNAAGALGKRLTVITKHAEDEMLTAVYDLEDIVFLGVFEIPVYPATKAEEKKFNEHTGASTGTLLILEKLDDLKLVDQKLKFHLGEVFRIFINNGVKITLNGKSIEPVFPLKSNYGGEVEINDQLYEFQKPDGTPFTLRIRFGFFPSLLKKEASKHGLTLVNQGFYVLRNDRQLERAKWFELAVKHNDFNRLRGEIYYNGDLDDVFKTNYEKNTLKVDQWFKDALKTRLAGQMISYKQRNVQDYNRNKLNFNADEEMDFKRIKDDIESKAGRIPRLHRHMPFTPDPTQKQTYSEPVDANVPEQTTQLKSPAKVDLIQFDTGRLAASNLCLFEDVGNGAVRIRFNVDHPFYHFFVSQTIAVKDAFAKLLFVMGRSIITIGDTDERREMLEDFQLKFGDEYRRLLE